MPGYIMHLCQGQYILDNISKYDLRKCSEAIQSLQHPDAGTADLFQLGSVLPDAADKSLTHFRPTYQNSLITKYPDMDLILKRYPVNRMTVTDLGILAHLYMDALYVEMFWPQYFRFEDSRGAETTVTDDIDHVRMTAKSMQRANITIPIGDFFSDRYFYGDYNVTNSRFKQDFHPAIPQVTSSQFIIKECSGCSKTQLAEDLAYFVDTKYPDDSAHTHVFPYEDMCQFIKDASGRFFELLKKGTVH